ncbi:MAG: ParB/RepB/Spo0J family partition protein [Lachnospiraceae bacterium]|nr:ParB/RepB/Spo0J family partition protein [Lachnospiraceae bacterium]
MTEIRVDRIRPFKGYPFRVADDEKMHELVESILLDGVRDPVIVRPTGEDEYEMISGHRRLFAMQQIGAETIPAVVKKLSDDEAVIAMVDANIGREGMLPSEKAFAYNMRYEAMRKGVAKNGWRFPRPRKELWTDEELAEAVGESRNQVHRYLRLTQVIPQIRDLVDRGTVALSAAVEISHLSEKVQEWLYEYMTDNDVCMTYQIYAVRDYLKEHGFITENELIRIVNENAPRDTSNRFQRIILTKPTLRKYFPVYYTKPQMEKVIFQLLEEWKKSL